MKRVIDLTMPLTDGMAVYPGDPGVEITDYFSYAEKGCRVSSLCIGSHSGSHVDMPAHFIEHGRTVTDISLARCFGTAFAVRAEIVNGEVAVPKEEIPDCGILLLYTEHERRLGTDAYFAPPPFSEELARFIQRRGFFAVGSDMPTVDHDGRIHRALLGSGILIYESLVNLEAAAGRSGVFYGFPLKIAGGDASPVRAVFCCD